MSMLFSLGWVDKSSYDHPPGTRESHRDTHSQGKGS